MRDALEAELGRAADDGDEHKIMQLIARKLAAKALEGDLGAIREIFDRVDGKTGEQAPRKAARSNAASTPAEADKLSLGPRPARPSEIRQSRDCVAASDQPSRHPAAFGSRGGKVESAAEQTRKTRNDDCVQRRSDAALLLKDARLRQSAFIVGYGSYYGIGASLRPRRRAPPWARIRPPQGDAPVPAII